MTRSKAKKNTNTRAIVLGCLGFGTLGACLLVVGVAAYIALRIRPVTEQMALGDLPMVVNLVDPTDGRGVLLSDFTPVHSEAIGSNPVSAMQLWVDGLPVDAHAAQASANGVGSAVDFAWQPATYGQHVLVARAIDSKGQTVNSNIVRVNANGADLPPTTAQILAGDGQTLTTLADQVGVGLDQLEAFNPGLDPSQTLDPNQPITIPIFTPPPGLDAPTPTPPTPPDPSLMPTPPAPPSGPTDLVSPSDVNPVIFWMGDNFPDLLGITSPPKDPALAAAVTDCQVHLYLTDNSADESGFFVYRLSPNANGFERVASLAAHTGNLPMEYIETGAFGASQYYVSAFNPKGESASNLVGVQITQVACAQISQKSLALDNAKIKVAQPVDKLYCYAAFANGPWRRVPSQPDTFVTPQLGQFDLSPYFNVLASPAPAQSQPLDLECWGWKGATLTNLGKVQYNFKVNEGGPVQIPGQGFILNGVANAQALNLPTLGLGNFKPKPIVAADQKIAPPFGFTALVSDQTVTLVWDWLPIGCPADQSANCPYVSDIAGYNIYDGLGNLALSVDATHKTASLALTPSSLIPTQCYQVVAFKDALESAPSGLDCVESSSPTPPLPSAEISAPNSLNITTDPADCKSHLPGAFLGFFTALCDGAASSQSLILTWNWNAGGCFPALDGQPTACNIITDIDGFHVYRAYLNGPGELVETINNPQQKLAILPPINSTFDCYLVQAFKGAIESGPSNTYCATFNQLGLNRLKLTPALGAGYGNLYTQKNCVKETWYSNDFPAKQFNNPSPDLGFNVGYIHKHSAVCDRTTAIWYQGVVGFNLSQLNNYTVTKATFLFHVIPGTNLSGDDSILIGSLNDLNTASNEACAAALVVADGYTNGTRSWQGSDPQDLGGAMWYGTQQIAPGPFGGHQALDITSYVQAALDKGQNALNLIFTANQSHPETTEICLSQYKEFGLALQLSPK